jgi:hypothetical protein
LMINTCSLLNERGNLQSSIALRIVTHSFRDKYREKIVVRAQKCSAHSS